MSDRAVHQTNAVVHFEISGADDDVLRRFYGDLLGWHVDPKGPGYALVHTPGGLAGAIVAGGTVLMPPTDNGWVTKAQIQDLAGNVLTLIQR